MSDCAGIWNGCLKQRHVEARGQGGGEAVHGLLGGGIPGRHRVQTLYRGGPVRRRIGGGGTGREPGGQQPGRDGHGETVGEAGSAHIGSPRIVLYRMATGYASHPIHA